MKYVFIAKKPHRESFGLKIYWFVIHWRWRREKNRMQLSFRLQNQPDIWGYFFFKSRNKLSIYLHILCKDILYHRSVHWLVGMGWGIWGESVVNRHEQFFINEIWKNMQSHWLAECEFRWSHCLTRGLRLFDERQWVTNWFEWIHNADYLPLVQWGQGKGDINIVGFHAVSLSGLLVIT